MAKQERQKVYTIEEAYAEGRITKAAYESTKSIVAKDANETDSKGRSPESTQNLIENVVQDECTYITVMLWQQFVYEPEVLHEAFALSDTDKYILDLTGGGGCKRNVNIKIKTKEDYARLTDDLLHRMILLKGNVLHERSFHTYSYNEGSRNIRDIIWKDKLAVLINTRHPEVRRYFRDILSEGTQALEEGKKFCLELSFGSIIRTWYGYKVDGDRNTSYLPYQRLTKSKHLTIFIHNSSAPVRFFMNKWVIACCCPCWLLSCGLCYCLFRSVMVTDTKSVFHGHSGMFQVTGRYPDIPVERFQVTGRHTNLPVQEATCTYCGLLCKIHHMTATQCN